jgi:hypothetical protein
MTITITAPPPPRLRRIPGTYDTDCMGYPHNCSDPGWLCSNWFDGCNHTTNGPENGRLTLCDECLETPQTPYV